MSMPGREIRFGAEHGQQALRRVVSDSNSRDRLPDSCASVVKNGARRSGVSEIRTPGTSGRTARRRCRPRLACNQWPRAAVRGDVDHFGPLSSSGTMRFAAAAITAAAPPSLMMTLAMRSNVVPTDFSANFAGRLGTGPRHVAAELSFGSSMSAVGCQSAGGPRSSRPSRAGYPNWTSSCAIVVTEFLLFTHFLCRFL